MIEFKADSMSMYNADNFDLVFKSDCINDMVVTSDIDTSSMGDEVLTFNHEATFSAEIEDVSPLMSYITDLNGKPYYIEYNTPIMIQARWHKKPRINKKWLKRYGMKKDNLRVKCNVESVTPNKERDPYYLTESTEIGMILTDMQLQFRPDQLRKNLKIEAIY